MTWIDPIVEEVRRVRDAYAARFNYDLWAIYRDLKEKEKRCGLKIVPPPERGTETLAGKAPQPNGPTPRLSDKVASEKAGLPAVDNH